MMLGQKYNSKLLHRGFTKTEPQPIATGLWKLSLHEEGHSPINRSRFLRILSDLQLKENIGPCDLCAAVSGSFTAEDSNLLQPLNSILAKGRRRENMLKLATEFAIFVC